MSNDVSYPLITYTENNEVKQFSDFSKLSQRVVETRLLDQDIVDFVNELPACGTIGVIVNNVEKAQKIAESINKPHLLLHSRFLSEDRAKIESKIMELIGKNGSRPDNFVIIGTQVLEQSLDIDFDLMITDLAPMDLLFQRIGRLHRFDLKHQSRPICYINLKNTNTNNYLYDQTILNNTLDQIKAHELLNLPNDIAPLTENVYQNPSEAYLEANEKETQKALTFMLDQPTDRIGTLDDFLRHGVIDSDKEQVAQMCVRDIKPQLTFIINKENIDDLNLLKRTIALPRKIVYDPYQFMQSWHGKTVDDLPVIDLPRTFNSWQVSYNNQLGLIETEA